VGAAAGPIGMAAGAAIGALAGGAAGHGAARIVNRKNEELYWRDAHRRAPYYDSTLTYDDDYAPAYSLGYNSWAMSDGPFDLQEARLSREWERSRGRSRLAWSEARHAARDAWDRMSQ
jgi:hypothetical protein